MKKQLFLGLLMLSLSPVLTAQKSLQSPDEFLPHRLGEQFTPHHLLVDYFEYVAANSPRVEVMEYGRTNEQRPLLLAFVSAPKNLRNLERIRENHLRRAGLLDGRPEGDPVGVVWLSFSVHGNEAAGSESSMAVLYELADPQNEETARWLENTVVILDPSVNPDGYSRYTHWVRGISTRLPDPQHAAREHAEPWPGGRVNHYLFDLNRDWAWCTQVESRQRILQYRRWMPHVHADLHEQFYNEPYYFAPAARPYHNYITDWQAQFQVEIGKNHARYFDREGWLYFTKEVFDLFYPSYGDTYPTFNGAIGMTYEQGGHSRAGRAIIMDNGDTLTLHDRVEHHKTTALSTVEVTSENLARVAQAFENYFKQGANDPPGKYKTFVIKSSNPPEKIRKLIELLDLHQIRYGHLSRQTDLTAFDYGSGREGRHTIDEHDLVISAYQPKAVLTQVLFEPNPALEDSLTYDITAWALPYAHGLEALASETRVEVVPGWQPAPAPKPAPQTDETAYAYLVPWQSLANARFLGRLLQEGIAVRYSEKEFSVEGKRYAPGTLVITRADNRKHPDFDATVRRVARLMQQPFETVQTGFVSSGSDFGSSTMIFIQEPRVAVLSGEPTSAYSFGQVWYFFEQDLGYPLTILEAEQFGRVNLDDFNLLILPEGFYRYGERELQKISDWIEAGGRLIAIGQANRALEDKKGFALTRFAKEEDKKAAEREAEEEALEQRKRSYSARERDRIPESIPGAITRVTLDPTHPLAFGLGTQYFSLKTNRLRYDLLKRGWNVGWLEEDPVVAGFVGWKLKKRLPQSVTFAVENKGRGSVIYMIDNPLYRAFWEQGKFLFANAVFFAGQ